MAARNRIEAISGVKVEDIEIDRNSIVHALKKSEHNLALDDLLLTVEVINTSTDIEMSGKRHLANAVLTFRKDIDGDITFLTEVRAKNGYFLVFNAYRQKKARSRRFSNAAQRPQGSHVQDGSARNEPVADDIAQKGNDHTAQGNNPS